MKRAEFYYFGARDDESFTEGGEKIKNKIQRSKVLQGELKSYGTPFGPKLLFIN